MARTLSRVRGQRRNRGRLLSGRRERVEIVSGWPDTNPMPSVSYAVRRRHEAWDRTISQHRIRSDAEPVAPSKVRKAGEIVEQAREAGSRFAAAKFACSEVFDNGLNCAARGARAIQSELSIHARVRECRATRRVERKSARPAARASRAAAGGDRAGRRAGRGPSFAREAQRHAGARRGRAARAWTQLARAAHAAGRRCRVDRGRSREQPRTPCARLRGHRSPRRARSRAPAVPARLQPLRGLHRQHPADARCRCELADAPAADPRRDRGSQGHVARSWSRVAASAARSPHELPRRYVMPRAPGGVLCARVEPVAECRL